MERKIKKAIIPAAGLGTRFLPASIACPKEMLTVVDKPVIQYIVEEAAEAGIEEILIITRSGKETIENHFDPSLELKSVLKAKGKDKELQVVENVGNLANIYFTHQREQLGLAHAIYQGRSFAGDDPFVVLLGDTIIDSPKESSSLMDMIKLYEKTGKSSVLVEYLENIEDVKKYGIVDMAKEEETSGIKYSKANGLVEKPTVEEAPSRYCIACRYVFGPEIFSLIEKTPVGAGGEYQITDSMKFLAEADQLLAYVNKGKKYDIGNKVEFIKANVELALRGEIGDEIREFIKKV